MIEDTFNQFTSEAVKTHNCLLERPIREHLNTHSDFCVFWREPCQHATHGVPSWHLTCIHAIVSLSPWGHGSVGPRQKALPAMNEFTLLWIFCLSPFIQDPFLWRTSQDFVKTDLYPLSLISLWYSVCSTGCWSIIGRCIGACQRSNCAEGKTTVIKKTSLFNSLNVYENRCLFGCPDFVSLTKKIING